MRTYDDWKTTDDTPEPDPPDMCQDCGGVGECGCDPPVDYEPVDEEERP